MTYSPHINSYISSDNSSTSILTTGSTYTGTWEDVNRYDSVVIAVDTDQDGIYYIDFSPDGVNTDSTLTRYYNTTDIEPPHRFTITRQYFRVRFTNDSGTNQTHFRLQTSVKAEANPLNIPLDGSVARDYDATATRPSDFDSEVALGLRQGWTTWNKFGYNADVDTAADEVIAEFGGSINIMTSGDTLDVVSSDTNDTSAGTGARTILITGIDENNLPQTETVTMNGVTPVTTSNSWLGVNRIAVVTAGTGGTNAGTITVDDNAGTVGTQATVPADQSVTQQCIFHTPINHNFLATWLWLGALKLTGGGGSPVVNFKGYSYSRVTGCTYEIFRANMDTSVENHIIIDPHEPFVVGGREILYFTAGTDTNNTEISARFSGKLIKTAAAE
jgi:hypothetical protein